MKTKKVKYILLSVALAALLVFTAVVPVACSCGEPEIDAPEFKVEKIADFANGANEDVVYARGGDGNGSVFNVEWNTENVEFVDDVARMKISEIPEGTESQWGDYYGAELRTNMWYHYGYYSVSMKPSKDSGTASTFFTYTGPYGEYDEEGNLHPWDEIDIEFLGKDTTKVQFNYYVNGKGGHEYMYDLGFDASEEFHTYGFLWEEDAITWYVDSEPVYQVTSEDEKPKTEGLPSTPGRIMLNHWCGTKDAEGWMDAYEGYSSPVEYQWIGTTSDPIEPITTPPGQDDPDEPIGDVSFTAGETIAPAFANANSEAGAYAIEPSEDGKTTDVTYDGITAGSYGENLFTEVTSSAVDKNAYAMTVTNNGDEAVNIRVDVMDTTITASEKLNHQDLNTTAIQDGEIVAGATDKEWGGSKFTVGAGETSEIVVMYDTTHFVCGDIVIDGEFTVNKVTIFIDSHMPDGGPFSGDVTITNVNFGTAEVSESEAPEQPGGEDPAPTPGGDEGEDPAPTPGGDEGEEPAPTPGGDEQPGTGGDTEVPGASMAGAYKWGENTYTLTPSADGTTLTVGYNGLSQYAGMGMDIAAGDNNTVTVTIKNNGDEAVDIKIDVGYQAAGSDALTVLNASASYNDGSEHESTLGGDKGAYFQVAANGTLTVTVTCDTSERAIEKMNFLIDSYNDGYETASGNIELSGLTFKTV